MRRQIQSRLFFFAGCKFRVRQCRARQLDFLAQVEHPGNLPRLLQVAKPQLAGIEFVKFMGGRHNRRVRRITAVKRVMAGPRQLGVNMIHDVPPVSGQNLPLSGGAGIRKLLNPPGIHPVGLRLR